MRFEKFLPLFRNSSKRRLALEANAAHDVVNVVAVQAAGGGQQDEVVAAFFQLVRLRARLGRLLSCSSTGMNSK